MEKLLVLMPNFVLNSSFSISVLWDLHLNLCSKMIFIIWNDAAEEGCVRSNQKRHQILSCFLIFMSHL